MKVLPFQPDPRTLPDLDLGPRVAKLRSGKLHALCVFLAGELADGGDARAREIMGRFGERPAVEQFARLTARLERLRPAARDTALETIRCVIEIEERRMAWSAQTEKMR